MRSSSLFAVIYPGLFIFAGCATVVEPPGETDGIGGTGLANSGGASLNSGGMTSSGGWTTGGGDSNSGGAQASGGRQTTGGRVGGIGGASSGGSFSLMGGSDSGGRASGGMSSGGNDSTSTGGVSSGGGDSSGGTASGGAPVELDCDAQMPTSGGETFSNTWQQGGEGNLAWQIWTNGAAGEITVYDVPAFTATWNNSGDYLGRMGLEWGEAGKKYSEYGTIKAEYVWDKSGNAGQYSYVGVYGWSVNPCVEWYIVEDSFHQMPFNTGDTPVGTVDIDGGTYNLVYRHTAGTGGDRCGGASSWDQFYSIRLEGKRCGTIDITKHFDAWADQGWNLGNMLEAKIVVEAAAGQGKVDFAVANVTTTQ